MSLDTFEKGSITHLLVLIVSILLVAIAVSIQRATRARKPETADFLRTSVGVAILFFELVHVVYWLAFRDGGFDLQESLPLHFCDITGLIAAGALIYPDRRLVSLFYFWGVGLSSSAFVVPVVTQGPSHIVFWTFWFSHLIIVGGAIFFVLAEGYRPRFRDLRFAISVSIAYAICLLALNITAGTNYGYVGKESEPTAFLGAWPFPRLPLMLLGGVLLETLAWVPFAVIDRKRTRSDAPT